MSKHPVDLLCINTLRFLAADMVEVAQSGHPGTPMGVAPVAYMLWDRFLRHSPNHPDWFNRDRFVLSSGHASALLYGLLHLSGYDLELDELKRFRQTHSRTPGHPEIGVTPGVELTTGPLGQGFATAVGMALAEAHLSARFNRSGHLLIDHYTYVIASDGDMMEGVSSEAASLAGHLKLGKLICLYDDNRVTIEGATQLAFSEDVAARFVAYGWHVQHVADGNDLEAVEAAIQNARAESGQPSLVVVRTQIGYGMPTRQGTAAAHYGALGPEELQAAKQGLDWPSRALFHVPEQVYAHMRGAISRGEAHRTDWEARLVAYSAAYPREAVELRRWLAGELPAGWESRLPVYPASTEGLATRMVNSQVINCLADLLPELIGGSADLAPNTQTLQVGSPDFSVEERSGRNLRFGVREHSMAAVCNGVALHGGLRPYAATFLVFSDYMRPSLRLAALTEASPIFLFTNDSLALGEDGPTHQPVEQIGSLRAIPDMLVLRPTDANEAVQAWIASLRHHRGPVCILLSRQTLPVLDRSKYPPAEMLHRGAYVLCDPPKGEPQAVLIATGSEVHLALQAYALLLEQGIGVRVVAMPSWELFRQQPAGYREAVLPVHLRARVSIEAGATYGWGNWVGLDGASIGMDRFGLSGPGDEIYAELGFTPQRVAQVVLDLLVEQAHRISARDC